MKKNQETEFEELYQKVSALGIHNEQDDFDNLNQEELEASRNRISGMIQENPLAYQLAFTEYVHNTHGPIEYLRVLEFANQSIAKFRLSKQEFHA